MGRSAHLEVKLPPHVKPTDETNEQLIKKFLKECSKESLLQFLAEKSAHSRRFKKKSVVVREKKLRYARNAKKYNNEMNSEIEKPKKKKKVFVEKQQSVQKSQ
jgi:hypothetical protein